ncbi:MAG TPA: D-alanine--D-alanine ligase family protein [Solirubrobacteraceae bacterium]
MSEPQRLTIALLAGGRSSEHEISLASARAVRAGLLAGGHEVLAVTIARDGKWLYDGTPLSICPGEGLLGADVAFPVLHGPFGEDGTVQGALEMLDVAYVGAGVSASALCMNKVLFKDLMSAEGIPQVDYEGVSEARWRTDRERIEQELSRLGLPAFVKPAHLGSSVGIVKVTHRDELAVALDAAFTHDALAIVEAASSGVEVECAVLGVLSQQQTPPGAAALASVPGQICLHGDWYDYSAKYEPGGMELLVPAKISAQLHQRVQDLAIEVFTASGCEGLARVDFFVGGEQVLVNELNTMPGFTPTSVYPKLITASGIDYTELVDRLCRLALERHRRRAAYRY